MNGCGAHKIHFRCVADEEDTELINKCEKSVVFINHAMLRETKGASQTCESAEVEQSAVCT